MHHLHSFKATDCVFYMHVVALAGNVVIGLTTGTRVKVVVSSLTVFLKPQIENMEIFFPLIWFINRVHKITQPCKRFC